MAKITDLKFQLNGKDYSVPVNCNSSGQFSANLPYEVWRALDLKVKMTANTKSDLSLQFFSAVDRYRKAQTSQELLIAIRYLSSGRFSENEKGNMLFGGYNNKYHLSVSFEHTSIDGLVFHFQVVIKETIDTVSNYFEAELGRDKSWMDKEECPDPDKYYKGRSFSYPDKFKFIPFSEAALNSLSNAREKIRSVSEMLFNFIEQDEKKIELMLTQNRLLTNK